MKNSVFKNDWLYIGALALIVIIIFNGFLFSDKMIPSSDQMQTVGSRVFFEDAVNNHHQFPMWLNSRLSGMPTVDAIMGDILNPIVGLLNITLPPFRLFAYKAIFHIFMAGLMFYLMIAKGFKFRKEVAFAGALFYMLNPSFVSLIYAGHITKMSVISLLPFLVWRLKALTENRTIYNGTLFASAVGLLILTAHIQIAYFAMWGAFVYWITASVLLVKNGTERKDIIKLGGLFWAASFIGIAVAAVQFIPAFLYSNNELSIRGAGKGIDFASSWSIHWPELFSVWVPEFGNSLGYYWGENMFKLNAEYGGAVVLILAIIALVYKRSAWRIFWASVAVFAITFAMGKHTPVWYIAYYIVPGVSKFRASTMMVMWFSFAIVILSTLSLKDILNNSFSALDDKRKSRWSKGLLISSVIAIIAVLLFSIEGFAEFILSIFGATAEGKKYQVFHANFSKNFIPALWGWGVIAVTTLLLLRAVIAKRIKPIMFLVIIVTISFVDLLRVDLQFYSLIPAKKMTNSRDYQNKNTYQEFKKTPESMVNIRTNLSDNPFRCYELPGTFSSRNMLGVFGLESVTGFHDFELKWYGKFRGRGYFMQNLIGERDGRQFLSIEGIERGNNFLNLANCKYIITRDNNGSPLPLENKSALGRVSFVTNYKVMSEDDALSAIMNNGYDIRTTIALLEEPKVKPQNSGGDNSATYEWQKYTPNYRRVKVTTNNDGFLRISEVYYPVWEIKIDGKKVDNFYRSDVTWMAISFPKGTHTVEIIPHSLFFKKGLVISLTTIAIFVIFWVFRFFSLKREDKK